MVDEKITSKAGVILFIFLIENSNWLFLSFLRFVSCLPYAALFSLLIPCYNGAVADGRGACRKVVCSYCMSVTDQMGCAVKRRGSIELSISVLVECSQSDMFGWQHSEVLNVLGQGRGIKDSRQQMSGNCLFFLVE
eukprot:6479351-Ditylum_brightwellii.AAC.1